MISDSRVFCFLCINGSKSKRWNELNRLQKTLGFLLILILAVLSGCGTGTSESNEKKATQPTEEETNVSQSGDENEVESSLKREDVIGVAAKVTRVVDGDTVKVELLNGKEETVRLILVDTPETKHPQLKVQPFGPEASDYTTEHLTNQEVTLEFDAEERDRYGRLLAYIWVDSKLFNEELVAKGLARVAVFPPNTKYVDEFRKTQDQARKNKLGIWSIENYVEEKGYNSEVARGIKEKEEDESAELNERCENKIKGNKNSKIYHVPTGAHYDQKMNNVQWFCTEEEAEEAGYRQSKN